MPETQDTKNTTDQARSGGAQTQESNRSGQGTSQATKPAPEHSFDASGSRERMADEEQKREIAKDSNHPGNPAEEWSPGTDQPNT
jgi:hypothetical protein